MSKFKKYLLKEISIVFLFLLPLIFINVKSSHDWGDDFAAYIHQAKNILQHKPQDETGYIVNPANLHDAPLAYQSGFPLLLAPVVAVFGEDISVLLRYVSLYYVGFALLSFFFFRIFFSFITSLVAVLILFYHPLLINFKAQVMSDIPFSFLFMTSIVIFLTVKNQWEKYLWLAVVTGFMMSVRSIGIVFVLAIIINHFSVTFRKNRLEENSGKQYWLQLIVFLSITLAEYFFINKIIFPVRTEGFSYYYQQFYSHQNLFDNLLVSFKYFYYVVKNFFNPNLYSRSLIVNVSWFVCFGFFLFGFFRKIISRIDFLEWLLLIYLFAVFLYTDHHQEFRFLIPILPLLIYYGMEGVKAVSFMSSATSRLALSVVCLFVVLQYFSGIERIIRNQNTTVFGPQCHDGKEMLSFLKGNTPMEAIISSNMPRVVCLYAERKCFSYATEGDPAFMDKNFRQMNTDYIVQLIRKKGFYGRNQSLDNYIASCRNQLVLVWNNSAFAVYRIQK